MELTCPWHLTDEHDPWDYHTQPSGNIILPESVQNNNTTYTVTRIGSQAFYCCDSITNIVIPNTVTLIGSEAFWNCRGLSGALTIPNSVTASPTISLGLLTRETDEPFNNAGTLPQHVSYGHGKC